jgi:hypothetical protein
LNRLKEFYEKYMLPFTTYYRALNPDNFVESNMKSKLKNIDYKKFVNTPIFDMKNYSTVD